MSATYYVLLLAAVFSTACTKYEGLPPIGPADRVVVSSFKYYPEEEIAEAETVKMISAFVDRQRQLRWTSFQSIPGSCNLMVTFMAGKTHVGYFVVYPSGAARTNGPTGPVEGMIPKSEVSKLLALIPSTLYPRQVKEANCRALFK